MANVEITPEAAKELAQLGNPILNRVHRLLENSKTGRQSAEQSRYAAISRATTDFARAIIGFNFTWSAIW